MIEAVIFDMDGVISDTQKFHSSVESRILSREGVEISPEEITQKYAGSRVIDFFSGLLRERFSHDQILKLVEEKRNTVLEIVRKEAVFMPGAERLIRNLYDKNMPIAVASSSNATFVNAILSKLEVYKLFNVIVSGDMVTKGKPDLEIFLLAASKLCVAPDRCLVIEDAIYGMQAAKSAGMKCIGLVPDRNLVYPTTNLVESLTEVNLEFLEKLE